MPYHRRSHQTNPSQWTLSILTVFFVANDINALRMDLVSAVISYLHRFKTLHPSWYMQLPCIRSVCPPTYSIDIRQIFYVLPHLGLIYDKYMTEISQIVTLQETYIRQKFHQNIQHLDDRFFRNMPRGPPTILPIVPTNAFLRQNCNTW